MGDSVANLLIKFAKDYDRISLESITNTKNAEVVGLSGLDIAAILRDNAAFDKFRKAVLTDFINYAANRECSLVRISVKDLK